MSSERYRWMLVDDFVDHINAYRSATFFPGDALEADESVIRWYSVGGAFVNKGLPISSESPTADARSRILLMSRRE
jgi:hypothetical protein